LTPTDLRTGPPVILQGARRPELRAHLRAVRTLRVTPAYVAAVAALRVTSCVVAGAAFRTALVQGASTNVANLAHGRFATVLTSAFVLEGRACLLGLVALGGVLAIAELAWGGLVLTTVFVYGHVVATLLVSAGLASGIWLHRLPESLASAADVGPSYGGVTVLGALLATPTLSHARRWRAAATVVAVAAVLVDGMFSDVGHLLALLLGFAVRSMWRVHEEVRPGPEPVVIDHR
jgi:hypothetical protein